MTLTITFLSSGAPIELYVVYLSYIILIGKIICIKLLLKEMLNVLTYN